MGVSTASCRLSNQEQTQEGQEWSVTPEAIRVIQERDDPGPNQGNGPGDGEKGSS